MAKSKTTKATTASNKVATTGKSVGNLANNSTGKLAIGKSSTTAKAATTKVATRTLSAVSRDSVLSNDGAGAYAKDTASHVRAEAPSPLSLKEKNVLEFLETYIRGKGISPTYQEICQHFGFASFNSVQRYLKQLEVERLHPFAVGEPKACDHFASAGVGSAHFGERAF